MSLEIGGQLAQLEELVARKRAGRGPRRVENRRRVAFRQHEAIGLGVMRILRIEPHLREKEGRHDLGRRHARRRMARAGRGRRSDRVDPKLRGEIVENSE